jgi:hypothetical protein
LGSVGYLVAAAAIALATITAYGISLMQRLAAARARQRELLKRDAQPVLLPKREEQR